jgi:acetylornithine deacetylase/succinyl-diaminopimelate desuccinylase-like protein
MIASDIRTEVSSLLAELIRIDTTNPPGNETAAAQHLAAYLRGSGLESTLVSRVPGRDNLVARIPGRGSGPSLLLLSHTDVVPADPDEWSVPPFVGLDQDGCIWGRGALDMKGQVAAEAVAVAALQREGWQGNGDLILCSVADEEVGDAVGAVWICEAHPELVRADYVINEGGGERLEHEGRVAYTICVGEKRCSGFEITVHGKSGHASTPFAADNALLRMVPVLERLGRFEPLTSEPPELARFMDAIGAAGEDPRALAERSRAQNPFLAELIEPMLGALVAPTGIEASTSLNVIPGRCSLRCDCRILPDQTQDQLQQAVAVALDGLDYEFRFLEHDGGTASPIDTPLFTAVEDVIERVEPGAAAAPTISAGFTDSHFHREAFGSVAYGFMPIRMDPRLSGTLIHSADERIPKDDLELAVGSFIDLARAVGEMR